KWSRHNKGHETVLLVATDGQIRVNEAYKGRISLPNYSLIPSDVSLEIVNLLSSDSGVYRCEIMHGIEDSQDTVKLNVKGEVFYATSPEKFTFQEAEKQCQNLGARLATTGELYLAWQTGMDVCSAGWLADRSVRYPISYKRPNCGGNLVGVRTVYLHPNQTGYPDPLSRYDAICYKDDAENITIQTVTQPGLELIFQRNVTEEEARGSIATLEGLDFTLTPSEDSFTATPVFPGTPLSPDLVPTEAPLENITDDGLQLWLENVTAVPSVEATGTVEEEVVPVTAAIDAAQPEKPISETGQVFFATQPDYFTFQQAQEFCESKNATLASTGQLYSAWKSGFDKCRAGWLSDGSVRYPIVTPRRVCGGDQPGVRTVYLYANQTGFPNPLSKYNAFCFR
ncbi:hypothetical protein AB205_0044260, partial [Aquarana catesbeiana]